MASKMCPSCYDCYPTNVWKAHQSHNGSYYCPGCKTLLHWDDLKRPIRDIGDGKK